MLREGAGIRNAGRFDSTFKRLADTFNARRCPRRDNEASFGRGFVLQETVGLGQFHPIDFIRLSEQALAKMGEERPHKLPSFLRHLQSMLGVGASAEAVDVVVLKLEKDKAVLFFASIEAKFASCHLSPHFYWVRPDPGC